MEETEAPYMMEELKSAVLNSKDLNTQYKCSDEPSAYDTPEEGETSNRGQKVETLSGKCNTTVSEQTEQGPCEKSCHQSSKKQSKEVNQRFLKPRISLGRKNRTLVVPESKPEQTGVGGNAKVAPTSNRVVPEPDPKEEILEVKSLILALEAIPRTRGNTMNFDTVAVSFWIAELQEGCYLSKLRYPGDKTGTRRRYTVIIDRDGLVAIRWKRMGVLGITDHRADLGSTEVLDADSWEFRMDTSVGEIFARALSSESFELWTQGMASIFSYARAFARKRRAEIKRYGF